VQAEPLYNSLKSNVINLTDVNWGPQVDKSRKKKDVWIVHFYKAMDGGSRAFSDEFKTVSDDMSGILKFGGLDCAAHPQVCDKQKITKFPSVVIYPPQPIPSINWEGPLNGKKISGTASSYVSNLVQEVTDDNMEGFFQTNSSMPKVILFTDKPKGISHP
jgi:hypothetical protein